MIENVRDEVVSVDGACKGVRRSKSASSLKADTQIDEEDLKTLQQLLHVSLAILESHIESEYLLGLYLLEKV